jgi:hypothetical protein
MGYEVLFSYNEKKENGYDLENVKILKKTVGKATEDTPLEHLAALIFRQFARRDVMMFNVEIYEYTKKKITFKETKDGILLKNKKFSFDLSTCDQIIETPCEETFTDTQTSTQSSEPVVATKLVPIPPTKKEQPLRYEIYDPSPDIAAMAKIRVKNFTLGKRYPIFAEKPTSPSNWQLGMSYLTQDDEGNRRMLNDKHFVPVVGALDKEFENDDRLFNERFRAAAQLSGGSSMPDIYTVGKK